MKSLIKTLKSIKLNKREKVLLITFIILFTFWMFNTVVYKPQEEQINSLKFKKVELDNEINKINNILKEENENRSQMVEIESSLIDIGSSYFPDLNQINLIYYLEDVFSGNEVIVKNLDFSEIDFFLLDDFEVQYITITIPFQGKYENIKSLIHNLNSGSFKLNIDSLYLSNINDEDIDGEIAIKIFCLENIISSPINDFLLSYDDDESYEDFNPFEDEISITVDSEDKGSKSNESSTNSTTREVNKPDNIQDNTKKIISKNIIDNFDRYNYYFLPSHELVNGSVNTFHENNNDYLRFEYWIAESDGVENRAYIDMSESKIEFRHPIPKLYLRVKSFNYSFGNIGIRLKSNTDEHIDVTVSEGIGWTGWNIVEFNLPAKLSLYPLNLTHIYYEIPSGSEDIGVLIFDNLEAEFPNYNDKINDFYIVREHDNLRSISTKIYGSDKYINEIIEINNLSSKDDIRPGRILILRRR